MNEPRRKSYSRSGTSILRTSYATTEENVLQPADGAEPQRRLFRSGETGQSVESRKSGFPHLGRSPTMGQALWISISIWVSSKNIVMKYAKAMGVRAEAIGLYAHSMQATAATDVVVAFHAMRGMYLHAERLLAKAG